MRINTEGLHIATDKYPAKVDLSSQLPPILAALLVIIAQWIAVVAILYRHNAFLALYLYGYIVASTH